LPRAHHPAFTLPEELLTATAERHGFRAGDYSLVWDGGEFDPSRAVHELAIVTGDGRRAVAQLTHAALSRRDPWSYLPDIQAAFKQLGRRDQSRGV
jgi:hypothetical protein